MNVHKNNASVESFFSLWIRLQIRLFILTARDRWIAYSIKQTFALRVHANFGEKHQPFFPIQLIKCAHS
jgi:hypothetical protein